MAVKQPTKPTPVAPDFKDVTKEEAQAAQAALAGGRQNPLKPPKSAVVTPSTKEGDKRVWTRWTERVVINQAYRTVTPKGLMDVVIIGKIRQGDSNNGQKLFSHFYMNNGENLSEGHEQMNERSIGGIITLLVATGYMPAGGALKGTLLNKMFPSKGQPGTASPLVGKTVIASVVQELGPQRDKKTNKVLTDDDGEPIMQKRDSGESFLPDTDSSEEGNETEE